jgi:alpha-beta hydrolase superfamily lysophospholipase
MSELGASEHSFKAGDGRDIFYRKATAEPERGRVVLVHGLGEHGGRYGHVARRLLSLGLSVFIPDHRGHGRSGGRRGHVARFGRYLTDLKKMVALAATGAVEDRRMYLVGHSLGGLIVTRYVQEFPEDAAAAVVSSPALRLPGHVPALKAALGRVMSGLIPWLSLSGELVQDKISHDPEVVRAYRNDPLVHSRVTARWFTETTAAMERALEKAPQVQTPMLFQLAGDDYLVDARGAREVFERLGAQDKTLIEYPDLYHEIYNETHTKQPLGDLAAWLEERI